jgi:hypothetical protein
MNCFSLANSEGVTTEFQPHVRKQPQLSSSHMWNKQLDDGHRGFFKLLQGHPQLLAIFVKLLQGLHAVNEVNVSCLPDFNGGNAFISSYGQLFFGYLPTWVSQYTMFFKSTMKSLTCWREAPSSADNSTTESAIEIYKINTPALQRKVYLFTSAAMTCS